MARELKRLRPRKRVRPIFKFDPEEENEKENELQEGTISKKPVILVRDYISNLDMEYIAWKAKSGKKYEGESEVVSLRLPIDLLKDINIMVQSGRTRFRERSEFIRTAIYILTNYYGNRFRSDHLMMEGQPLSELEDMIKYRKYEKDRTKKIITEFKNIFPTIKADGETEIHRYLTGMFKLINKHMSVKNKNKIASAFCKIIKAHGINPEDFVEELIVDESENQEIDDEIDSMEE